MKRILVLGPAGSGKSTFTEKLANRLSIPYVHLDSHFWKPNWVGTPADEWLEIVKSLIARKEWVMDGNYARNLEVRIGRADTVIFLDASRLLSFWRIFK